MPGGGGSGGGGGKDYGREAWDRGGGPGSLAARSNSSAALAAMGWIEDRSRASTSPISFFRPSSPPQEPLSDLPSLPSLAQHGNLGVSGGGGGGVGGKGGSAGGAFANSRLGREIRDEDLEPRYPPGGGSAAGGSADGRSDAGSGTPPPPPPRRGGAHSPTPAPASGGGGAAYPVRSGSGGIGVGSHRNVPGGAGYGADGDGGILKQAVSADAWNSSHPSPSHSPVHFANPSVLKGVGVRGSGSHSIFSEGGVGGARVGVEGVGADGADAGEWDSRHAAGDSSGGAGEGKGRLGRDNVPGASAGQGLANRGGIVEGESQLASGLRSGIRTRGDVTGKEGTATAPAPGLAGGGTALSTHLRPAPRRLSGLAAIIAARSEDSPEKPVSHTVLMRRCVLIYTSYLLLRFFQTLRSFA